MPYIGVSPQFGVRRKHTYTATAGQTSFSGAGSEGATLSYKDSTFVDVYQNGVKLGEADYTSTSGTAIVLLQGASVSDLIEIVVFDVFSVADTVSKADGGTFDGAVTLAGGVSGNTTFSGEIITSTSGTSNVRIGENAGDAIQSGGRFNTVVGEEAGTAITTGDSNTMIGMRAGDAITTSSGNVALGADALSGDTVGSRSVAIGQSALEVQNFTSATNTYNTAVGFNAGAAVTTGTLNTIVGGLSGDALTTGGSCTAIGHEALSTSQDGAGAVAVGYRALFDMTSGARNVGLGEQAGRGITTGNDNLAMGQQSFYAACTGSANIGFGYRSFFSATSAASNVGVGYQTLSDMNSGSENVAVGYRALPHVSTGDSNIGVGKEVGDGIRGAGLTTGASNILIGRQTDVAAADNSYCGVFGVHAVGKGSSTGYFSFNDGAIYQGNNNASWTTTSDIRIKKNIVDSNIGLEELKKIQVRNFEYRTEDEITEVPSHAAINKQGVQVGVIAQEIQAVLPDTVKEESTGVLSVNPDNLTWHLVKAIQELSAKNDVLEARIKKLEES